MAYRGRGGSIKGGFKSESQHNGRVGINIHRNIYLDESEHVYKNYGDYIWGEIITLILIGIVVFIGIIIMIFNYESAYIYDPIESVKNNFIDLQFVGLILSGIFLGIAAIKRKSSKNAYKFLIATFISMLIIIITTILGYNNFFNKYNVENFEKMYTEFSMKKEVEGNPKDIFIEECNKLNEKFKIKVITICVIEYILVLINLILFISAIKYKNEYKRIEQENDILFDENINIKY